MKYLKEFINFTTTEGDRINDILDKGLDNASDEDMEILRNKGKIKKKKSFFDAKFHFKLEGIEDFGDEIKVKGILTYHNEDYYGWFTLPKGERQGRNTWDFFQGSIKFSPDPNDLYDLDSFMQEIEFEYI